MAVMTSAHTSCRFERAGPADLVGLVDLIHLCFAELAVLTPPSGAAGETAASLGTILETGALIKALTGSELAGCIAAERRGREVYVGRLSVRPDRRRQGIAQGLLAAAEAFAREVGAEALTLNVRLVLTGNIRLFEGAGYRITAQGSHPGFTVPTYHIMQKFLT
ncbi:MAG: GNAT family N-acetyltransferase [Proteobacteria bacterium]|nr:GNAT family N-acetyltransferase [Pseudomonadota bacterium]